MQIESKAIPQAVRRSLLTSQKPEFEGSVATTEAAPSETEDYFYTRQARATGGSVKSGMSAQMLMAAVERAKANGQRKTESILKAPDEHVVHALKVANEHI
jgi:hypothetical protein